ncbi:MAG: hypothetical protein IAC23_08290 [Bacteroidetes bacterium]|uniref:Lipoprotein n=1 Tax=Candidatus Cryptobacteroides merdavium TaxID=2840769 RepID=A0A9D9EE97_9BACT|nr:hypothetical protein [Candidatus Cryptobacteroides merdavium]
MKKILLLSAVVLMAASCSVVNKAQVESTSVYTPAVETTTMATLDVSPNKISYRYVPDRKSAKSLSPAQLLQNAIYAALQENGNADELVEVNYSIAVKRVFFGKRIRSISLSGYPARYVDFREPTGDDLKNVETLSRSKLLRTSDPKTLELHLDK